MGAAADPHARADARIAELGAELSVGIDAMSGKLKDVIASAVVPLQGDPSLLALLHASVKSNLETLVHLMRYDTSVAHTTAPVGAQEYARRLAQRGISSTALIRAYRLAQQSIVDWAFDEFHRLEPDTEVAMLAGRRFAELTFRYVDAVSEQVVEEYEAERERWLSNRNTLRAAMIESLVVGNQVNVVTAEQAMGYRLRQRHLGVILWAAPDAADEVDLALLERAVETIAEPLGCSGKPLFLPRERALAWAWLPLGRSGEQVDIAAATERLSGLQDGLRAAVGTAGADAPGFRISHDEARRARTVALCGGAAGRLVSYSDTDVRTAAILATDPESTRRLVRTALGDLALDNENAGRQRDTLRIFLLENGSHIATAERLHLHKNTVKYRVQRAVEQRGRPLDDERLELELALVACDLLGPTVLRVGTT